MIDHLIKFTLNTLPGDQSEHRASFHLSYVAVTSFSIFLSRENTFLILPARHLTAQLPGTEDERANNHGCRTLMRRDAHGNHQGIGKPSLVLRLCHRPIGARRKPLSTRCKASNGKSGGTSGSKVSYSIILSVPPGPWTRI